MKTDSGRRTADGVERRARALGLGDIVEKIEARERLTLEEGVRLFDCPDLLAVGWLANRERERRHGDLTYYNYNIRIEATNVCVASCLFCSFARLKPGDPGSYTMTLEQAWDKLRQRADRQQIRRVEEADAVLEREALAGPQLLVDLGQPGRANA